MNDWVQLLVVALIQGIGTGSGIAIGTYFASKSIIKSVERLAEAVKKGKT